MLFDRKAAQKSKKGSEAIIEIKLPPSPLLELSFRDLKSHRYGHAFEDSLTRKGNRIEVLLLLHTMAAFASWLVGMACETAGIDQWLTPFRSKRRLYSIMRLGREALLRRWSNAKLEELMEQIRKPSPVLLDQMAVAT